MNLNTNKLTMLLSLFGLCVLALFCNGCTTIQPIKEVEKKTVVYKNVVYQLGHAEIDDYLIMNVDTVWVVTESKSTHKYLTPELDTSYYSPLYGKFFKVKK
jgi:hypothetical protein